MLLIDGAYFYSNCKVWKKFQKEKHGRNCLVALRKHDDSNPKREKRFQYTQLMKNWELSLIHIWRCPSDGSVATVALTFILTVKYEKSFKRKSMAEIAWSHWESMMIQTLRAKKDFKIPSWWRIKNYQMIHTSCRSESTNVNLVILVKLLFWFQSP